MRVACLPVLFCFVIASMPLAQGQIESTLSEKARSTSAQSESRSIIYRNIRYGFTFTLPASWKGYKVLQNTWRSDNCPYCSLKKTESGPTVVIRNPHWTANQPWVDIPIMIFTIKQSEDLEREEISLSGAAPVGPAELARNGKYVFYLPTRFGMANDGWLGYDEVNNHILPCHPIQPLWTKMVNAIYTNEQYGFTFTVPPSWKGYKIIYQRCNSTDMPNCVSEITIRHPKWTAEHPREIPIIVLTFSQAEAFENQSQLFRGELGRNRQYVFALPPYYDFAQGLDAVQQALGGNLLCSF